MVFASEPAGFGDVPIGSSSDIELVVTNISTSTAATDIQNGSDSLGGEVTFKPGPTGVPAYPGKDGTCGSVLGPRESCVVRLTFSPISVGNMNPNLRLVLAYHNGDASVTSVRALSGRAVSVLEGPVPAAGAAASVATGYQFSCAVADGGVKCWGDNSLGQLGSSGVAQSNSPISVKEAGNVALQGAQAVAAGYYHACAIVNGGVKCWGETSSSAIETGTGGAQAFAASAVLDASGAPLTGVQAIGLGYQHTCALIQGGVWCWGANESGQLGSGNNTSSNVPVAVQDASGAPLSGVQAIAVGDYFGCALAGGSVRCWGADDFGQLGRAGGGSNQAVSVLASAETPLSGVRALGAGAAHACAVMLDGSLKCWGSNSDGQLGDGSVVDRASPVTVLKAGTSTPLAGVTAVDGGWGHTCALANGSVWCSGDLFQDADQTPASSQESHGAALVAGLSAVSALATEVNHACALGGEGPKCWGANSRGQLGNGGTSLATAPVSTAGLSVGIRALAAGELHSCVLNGGGVDCWGFNSGGLLGRNDLTTLLEAKPGAVHASLSPGAGPLSGAYALAAGGFHSCVIAGGGVQCWGVNDSGQLGDGTTQDRAAPVPVTGLSTGVQALALGAGHSCALVAGGVKCWGRGFEGAVPTPVEGMASGVRAIEAGANHTCALMANGSIRCWGSNSKGQLGEQGPAPGEGAQSLVPVAIQGLSGPAIAIAAGETHTCALLASGEAQCWGSNTDSQLGNRTFSEAISLSPVTVLAGAAGSTPLAGIQALSAGKDYTCAIVAGATLCWGLNVSGQLGSDIATVHPNSAVPLQATGMASSGQLLEAGREHACVLASGRLRCWGDNLRGQLGDATDGNYRALPRIVFGF